MSRGMGPVQLGVLEYLRGEHAGRSDIDGTPRWESVIALARQHYQEDVPTDAQRASMRRALRRLAALGLVEVRRGPTGGTYRQHRHRRRRYLTACQGPGCLWCVHVRHREYSSLLAEQLAQISGTHADRELANLDRYGWHEWLGDPWHDYDLTEHTVAVTELHARRALTTAEHHAAMDAVRAYIAAAVRRDT